MAEGDDKPTILPEFVADVLRAGHRLHPNPLAEKIAAAKQFVPEIVRAGLDFVNRLKREERLKREQANPPSANPDPPAATTTPVSAPLANPTIPLPPVLRRAKRGEQEARVRRLLRLIHPPHGRVPMTQKDNAKAVWRDICAMIKAEREAGSIPENERDLPDPSYDVIRDVIREDRGLSPNSPVY